MALKLGIIGLSEGNGHPYSWGAIFNGYDPTFMKDCSFEVIPQYLAKQKFPDASIPDASVTHIWTQDKTISNHVAKASNIPEVVDKMEDLIGEVDGILLARDDPENHFAMSRPFIEAGMPIFIDKPIATNCAEAEAIFQLEQYEGQIFTCSSLRYAKEFNLSEDDFAKLGRIKYVDASIPKSWTKYAVHIIEPVLKIIGDQGKPSFIKNTGEQDLNIVTVKWDSDIIATFKVLGKTKCPLSIRLFGEEGFQELLFQDTFHAFKQSLVSFVASIKLKKRLIPKSSTMEVVHIIEHGFLNN